MPPPVLPEWASGYLRAFWALNSDRGYATDIAVVHNMPMAVARPLAIPFQAINHYGVRYGIDGQSFERLVRFVRALDTEYLKIISERTRKGPGSGGDGEDT